MEHIRPHQALGLFETKSFYERISNIVLPEKLTPNVLETCILIALARSVEADVFFEFGTFRGVNTLNIAANLGKQAKVYTLDLDIDSFDKCNQHNNDKVLSEEHFAFEERLAFLRTPFENNIVRLFGDSKIYDFSPFYANVNMIYIDGGHDLETVKSDTEQAFKMLDNSRVGCIAWHDYGNKTYPELTQFLEDLSSEYDLKHVEETRIVFFINTP